MKIEQRCQLYIDFETKTEEKKQEMAAYFKRYFKNPKHKKIDGIEADIEVVDDASNLIVLDVTLVNQCDFVGGSPASRWEPGEPDYLEGVLTQDDFDEWLERITDEYDDNEIIYEYYNYWVDEYYIPTEDELLGEYYDECERRYYEER